MKNLIISVLLPNSLNQQLFDLGFWHSNIHLLNNKSYGIYLLGTEHLSITEGLCFSFPESRKKLSCKTKIRLVLVFLHDKSVFFSNVAQFFNEYCQILFFYKFWKLYAFFFSVKFRKQEFFFLNIAPPPFTFKCLFH